MSFLQLPTLFRGGNTERDLDRLQLVAADLERLLDHVIETGEQVLAQTTIQAPSGVSHSTQEQPTRKRMIDIDR